MGVKTFDVMREHEGDRFYRRGETRDLDAGEAKHLEDLGVLVEKKAEKSAANKAETPVPANKGAKA